MRSDAYPEKLLGRWCLVIGIWIVATVLTSVAAQSPSDISASIVRISTASRQGTGVVVAVDGSGASIVTASHVLLGEEEYEVVFAADQDRRPFKSSKSNLHGWEPQDDIYGLAAFRVTGAIPGTVKPAAFGTAESLQPLDALVYNGFPGRAVDVQYFNASFSAPAGRTFSIDRSIGEGASGGAIVKDGKIVGIASARGGLQTFAVKSEVVVTTLRGWKVDLPADSNAANRPPTSGSIDVTYAGSSLLSNNRVGLMAATKFTLTAKGISDPDGDQITYNWDLGDGTPAPPSSPRVEKIYKEVNKFHVRLFVTDGKHPVLLAGETDITIRDVSGTWLLTIKNDPSQSPPLPERLTVTLNQKGNLLDGRIVPDNGSRPTTLTGEVRHPAQVYFGSEHAWWNDEEDSYFELEVSDGLMVVQMRNAVPGRCGPGIKCLSAFFQKQ